MRSQADFPSKANKPNADKSMELVTRGEVSPLRLHVVVEKSVQEKPPLIKKNIAHAKQAAVNVASASSNRNVRSYESLLASI